MIKQKRCIFLVVTCFIMTIIFTACVGNEPDFSDPNLNVEGLDKVWQFKYYNDSNLIKQSQDALADFISSNGKAIKSIANVAEKEKKFATVIKNGFSQSAQATEIADYLQKSSEFFNGIIACQEGKTDYKSLYPLVGSAKTAFNNILQDKKDKIFTDRIFSYDFYKDGISTAAINTSRLMNTKSADDEIIITFAGNTMLGNEADKWQTGFNEEYYSKNKSQTFPFLNVMPYFLNDDYTVLTYEGNITTKSPKVKNGFNGFPEYAKLLKNSSVEIASVATEHAGDFYEAGNDETIKNLTDSEIGVFSDKGSYSLETKIGKIAFLSYELSETEPDVRLAMIDDIKKANQEKHQIIIINFHWGYKETQEVSPKVQKLAHQAVSYGADVVIGSHPYVIQGLEQHKNHPIVYSMGNLCMGADTESQHKENFLFRLTIKKTDKTFNFMNFEIIPVITGATDNEKFIPSPVIGADGDKIINKIKNISSQFESPLIVN